MPVKYRIDTTLRLVHVTWEGRVSMREAVEYADRLRADPDFEPNMAQISDARELQMQGMTTGPAEIRDLALKSPFGPGSRRAIVVDDDAVYGISRMYQAFAHGVGPEIHVFRSMDAARAWLGLDVSAAGGEAS